MMVEDNLCIYMFKPCVKKLSMERSELNESPSTLFLSLRHSGHTAACKFVLSLLKRRLSVRSRKRGKKVVARTHLSLAQVQGRA